MNQLTEMLAQWTARDGEADAQEKELRHLVSIAPKESKTLPADLLRQLQAARKAHADERAKLETEIAARDADEAALKTATAIDRAGTLDAELAIKNAAAVTALVARVRHRDAVISRLAASAHGLRARFSVASAYRAVLGESRELLSKLVDYGQPSVALDAAEAQGKRARSTDAAWWPVCEALVLEEAKPRLADLAAHALDTGVRDLQGGGWSQDWRREPRRTPTLADLQTVFAKRAAAFESKKRAAAEQLAALTSEVADLGRGAA